MFQRKSNKILIRLLALILIFNALPINLVAVKANPFTLKISNIDACMVDSIVVQQSSLCELIDASNNYGHPHQGALDKIVASKASVYRADLKRAIAATSNGSNITINKKASPIKINAPPRL